MTAEDFVKKHLPQARAESYKENGVLGKRYYLIRNGRSAMYFAQGDTKAQAWQAAKKKLVQQLIKEATDLLDGITRQSKENLQVAITNLVTPSEK